MRRALLALASTAAGLVLLLSFRSHAPTSAATSPPSAIATTGIGGATSSGGGTSTGSKTVTGQPVDTRYGPVQVQVTATNGKIVDVRAVQLPQSNPRDIEIDNYAIPQLRQEALAAQSAHIDMVSGATYTSQGYISSLQSAVDRLKA